MDLITIGNYPSAKILVKIIQNDRKQREKVVSFLSYFNMGLIEISKSIEFKKLRMSLLLLWRNQALVNICNMSTTDEIKGFLCNIVKTQHKRLVRKELGKKNKRWKN